MTAPIFRSLDQLTGDVAESPIAAILEAADEISGQAEALALARADADDSAETIGLLLEERDGLRCRVQELEAELVVTRRELGALKAEMAWGSMP